MKPNVFLRKMGLNFGYRLDGGNFAGTLLELLNKYKKIEDAQQEKKESVEQQPIKIKTPAAPTAEGICPKCEGRGCCDKSRNGNLEYGTCDKCGGSGKLLLT